MALLLSTISDPKGLGALANKSLLLLFSENKIYIRIQSHRDRHAKLRNHIVLEHPENINLVSPLTFPLWLRLNYYTQKM